MYVANEQLNLPYKGCTKLGSNYKGILAVI